MHLFRIVEVTRGMGSSPSIVRGQITIGEESTRKRHRLSRRGVGKPPIRWNGEIVVGYR